MRRPTLLAARVVAALGAVWWGWLFFGVQDALTVFIEGRDFAAHYVMESGWGLLFLALVAVPLIGLVIRPRSPVLVAQVAAVGVAVLLGAVLAGSAAHLLPGAGVLVTALAVAGCGRLDVRPRHLRADWPLVVCVALAVVPAVGYARRMASSTADVEITWNLDHYPIQAGLGIAVVLIGAVIAVADGSAGARLATVTFVVTIAWIGLESVIYPHRVGSLGTTWGWTATGWAVTFLALAFRRDFSAVLGRRPQPEETASRRRPDDPPLILTP
jgi:hypothetical protein